MDVRRYVLMTAGLAAAAALAGCASSGTRYPQNPPAPPVGTISTSPSSGSARPSTSSSSLAAPDATQPAAGSTCARTSQPVVTIEVRPDASPPPCVTVSAKQQLRVVNRSGTASQHGSPIVIIWADFPTRSVPAGAATSYDRPFGQYLAPGVHDLHVSNGNTTAGQVWLQ